LLLEICSILSAPHAVKVIFCQETLKLTLADEDGEIGPVPASGGGHKPEPDLDRLSNIIKAFNDQIGNIDWKEIDRIRRVNAEEIPGKVAADKAYRNTMKNSDTAAARLEHDRALQKVVIGMLADHTELLRRFSDDPSFRKCRSDAIFGATYEEAV
jgi:type I restriction enzyme, R subunit